jgi:hypothetical protein
MNDKTRQTHLTAEEAKLKALDYRELAEAATHPEDRIMFEHMAEIWEHYAKKVAIGQ